VGVSEEIFRIRYEVRGAEQVERLRQQYANLESQQKRMNDLAARAGVVTDSHRKEVSKLSDQMHRLASEIRSVEEASLRATSSIGQMSAAGTRYATGGRGKAGGGGNSQAAMKMQQAAYIVDDLQYVGTMGLQPILNNLTQVSAKAGIAAVILYQLYRNWDVINDALRDSPLGPVIQQFDALGAKLEEVTDNARDYWSPLTRIRKETEELSKANAELAKSFDAIRGSAQQSVSNALQEAVKQFGGGEEVKKRLDAIANAFPGNPAEKESRKQALYANFASALGGDEKAIDSLMKRPGLEGLRGLYTSRLAEENAKTPEAVKERERRERVRQEAEDHNKEAARLQEDATQEAIRGMRDRFTRAATDTGQNGPAPEMDRRTLGMRMQLQQMFSQQGFGQDVARVMIENVMKGLNENFETQVRERMLGGQTRDEAIAGIRKDQREREEAQGEADTREQVGRTRRAMPGLNDEVSQNLVRAMMRGATPEQASASVSRRLAAAMERRGLGDGAGATAIVDERLQGLRESIAASAMNARNMFRPVETIAAQDFARSVQDGGTDYAKDQTELLKKSVDYLGLIARNQGGRLR
jgi:hypothetical protein